MPAGTESALIKVSQASRLTGLSVYKLMGLARCGHLKLKRIPVVSGKSRNRFSHYFLRDEILRLIEAPEQVERDDERKRRDRIDGARRRAAVRAALARA